jgi:hypothetical protein
MSTRSRSLRDRNMVVSHSQPAAIRLSKTPLMLPHIPSKRPKMIFYDELTVSPDYVHISRTEKP